MSSHMVNENLFCALRNGFPANLEAIAVETDDGLCYSWLDLERGSAMMANWLHSLSLPEGSRIAVQVEKSVEVLMLYLATLRSGHVFLPLNPAYQANEMAYFMTNAVEFFLLAFLVATVLGGSQALSRALFARKSARRS